MDEPNDGNFCTERRDPDCIALLIYFLFLRFSIYASMTLQIRSRFFVAG